MRLRRFGGLAVASVFYFDPAFAQNPLPNYAKWQPWFEVGAYASSEKSRLESAAWLPLMQGSRALLFADLRGKLFDDDQREGNAALGYRQMLSGGWNFGGWLGFDRRQTAFGSHFNQIAFGVEALHPVWAIRANAYLPTEDSRLLASSASSNSVTTIGASDVQITGGNILMVTDSQMTTTTILTQTRELALRGLDAEMGYKLPSLSANSAFFGPKQEFRVFAGGFAFEHRDLDHAVAGPKLRAEWRFNDPIESWAGSKLTLEAQYRWDEVRGHHQEVGLRLRLPLGNATRSTGQLSAQERLMAEAVHRDTDVVSQAKTTSSVKTTQVTTQTTEKVSDVLTGVVFDRAVVVSNGSDLQSSVTAAAGNSLIIAQGGAANFGRVALLDNQTLIGGGTTITVRGVTSGILADFTASGSRPTLAYTAAGAVVQMANNTHIDGVAITGAGHIILPQNHGIFGNGLSNVVINNVAINDVGDSGIVFADNNTNIRITNSQITNIADGIIFNLNNSNILVQNNVVSNTFYDGIIFQSGNTGVRVIGNSISNIGDDAIGGMGSNQIEYSRNTFAGHINDNLLDIFLTNGNSYTGSGNVFASGLTVGNRFCEASPGPTFTGSFSFTDGTVFRDNVAPCN